MMLWTRRGIHKNGTSAEILREWWRGCSNTIGFFGPWRCRECTVAMLRAALRQAVRLNWWRRAE